MNIRDPLFPEMWKPSRGPDYSSETSTANLGLHIPDSLFIGNIAHQPAADTTVPSIIDVSTTSLASLVTSATSLPDFSQVQTDANVSAINEASSAPSPHLWNFVQFLYISLALSVATIVLPIIAGPVFRVTIRSFYKYKVYWRIGMFIFVLSSTIVLDIYIPPLPFEVVFAAPQAVFAVYKLVETQFRRRQKKRWSGYATLLALCIVIDFEAPAARAVKTFIHYGKNVGLAAFIPTLYLFVIWMQTDPPIVGHSRLLSWRARLRSRIPRRRGQRNIRYLGFCAVLGFIGINSMLGALLPGLIYVIATGIPFGLYAIDKLVTSVSERKHLKRWATFAVVVGLSLVMQLFGLAYFVGISALLPSIYLGALHYRHKIRTWYRVLGF